MRCSLMINGFGRYLLVQEVGPGRSTRCAFALEFQDHRQIRTVHDDRPRLVKFSRRGPSLMVLRNTSPMAPSLPNPGMNDITVVSVSRPAC
jgi:hypothetical protein